jgi:hypothetical protein
MDSMEREGVVSVWTFRKKVDPADSGKDVLKEFAGVDSYDLDYQETVFREVKSPLRDLVTEMSYSDTFVDAVVAAAARLNIHQAIGVVAQYNFAYDPTLIRKPIRKDPAFLGYFDWHD